MWTGYNLFREQEFPDFAALRAALEEQLGDLGPMSGGKTPKKPAGPGPHPGSASPPPATPSAKKQDVDFDDAE
jgi:hypothetical protein